jgi:hypothetical protein
MKIKKKFPSVVADPGEPEGPRIIEEDRILALWLLDARQILFEDHPGLVDQAKAIMELLLPGPAGPGIRSSSADDPENCIPDFSATQ